MNEKESIYELRLSYLENLQIGKMYRYSLANCASENRYSVSVSEWENDVLQQESTKKFTADSKKACNVVQWLYENAVAPVHLHDVLQDLKYLGHIAMQE